MSVCLFVPKIPLTVELTWLSLQCSFSKFMERFYQPPSKRKRTQKKMICNGILFLLFFNLKLNVWDLTPLPLPSKHECPQRPLRGVTARTLIDLSNIYKGKLNISYAVRNRQLKILENRVKNGIFQGIELVNFGPSIFRYGL